MTHSILIKTIRVRQGGGSASDRVGWIRIVDIQVPGGATSSPVYQDPPDNTILQSITTSSATFDVIVESSFPKIELNEAPAVLPLVGSIYRGSVSVTLVASGDVVAKSINPEDTRQRNTRPASSKGEIRWRRQRKRCQSWK